MSMGIETKDKIREIVEPVVFEHGFELVDIELCNESHGMVLRIIIYKDSGVGIDDCSAISREVGYLLEIDDPLPKAYLLEVSSPGLDRPLRTARDFERTIGKKITVHYEADGNSCSATGEIQAVSDNSVIVKTAEGEADIPLAEIKRAKQVIEF